MTKLRRPGPCAAETTTTEAQKPIKHQVEIWTFSLVADEPAVEAFSALLSNEEKARADRFSHLEHKDRYIIAHGRTRQILAQRIGLPPHELAFCASPTGKPFLAPENPKTVHFNLSHCADQAALAVCETAEVGVDIEMVRTVRDGFARRFFTAEEAGEIEAQPEGERLSALFRCWTRKEAFLKATGEGIARGLASFRVSLAPDDPPRVIDIGEDSEAAKDWALFDFSPAVGVAGAAALLAPYGAEFILREFPE